GRFALRRPARIDGERVGRLSFCPARGSDRRYGAHPRRGRRAADWACRGAEIGNRDHAVQVPRISGRRSRLRLVFVREGEASGTGDDGRLLTGIALHWWWLA